MLNQTDKTELFHIYYKRWITVYKEGAIRKVTMAKYLMTQQWLEKLVPKLCVCHLTRLTYQQLLNDYAAEHERQTIMDFHHQLKGAILDAVDEGLIDRDPTRKDPTGLASLGKEPSEGSYHNFCKRNPHPKVGISYNAICKYRVKLTSLS